MGDDFNLRTAMTDVLANLLASVSDFIPRAITALVVILIGLVVAKIIERVLKTAFDKLRLDDLLEKAGVTETLTKFGMTDKPGKLVSRTAYVLLVTLFVQAVTRAVGLDTVADAIGAFFSYLPNLVAAFMVLLFGMMVAQFLGRSVTTSGENAGMDYAPMLGRLVSGLVFFVVVIMAVSQLQIEITIVRTVVTVLLSGFALALALSFGLGTRQITRNIVAGFYARKLFEAGSPIEIRGERGTLASISALQTVIESENGLRAVPNSVFLDEVIRS